MKIKKFHDKKLDKTQEILFDVKSLEREVQVDKHPAIISDKEQLAIDQEFKKNKNKIEKFESFITVNIDHVDNINYESEDSGCGCCDSCTGEAGCYCGCDDCQCETDSDNEFYSDSEESETSGCGCCDSCTGEAGCQCGCDDCQCETHSIKKASDFINTIFSENIKYHLDNNKPITENIFRPGSKAFFNLIKEARELFDLGRIDLCNIDRELYESTDIGRFGVFNGELVPLDLPMENIIELNEAEYKGKEVKLNKPTRSSGPKKYKVYVKNPKTGRVKVINFGDVKGGLTAKLSDPKARKSFSARHKCHLKKDKTKAGYFACRLTKYGHLFGGKTYPGFW